MLKRKKLSLSPILSFFTSSAIPSQISLDPNEKKMFYNDKKVIASVNHVFRILNNLSILTPEIRKKTIEITLREQNNRPFKGVIETCLLHLQDTNTLTRSAAHSFIMYSFSDQIYHTGWPNLIALALLKISTPEYERIAVCCEDLNNRLPGFLKLIHDRNIILNNNICFALEDLLVNTGFANCKLDSTIYKLKKLVDESKAPSPEILKNKIQQMRIERILNYLPTSLETDPNKQTLQLLNFNENSIRPIIWFFGYLNFGKIFTQENFNKIISCFSHLHLYVHQIMYTNNSVEAELNFEMLLQRIQTTIVAQQYVALKQGFRNKNSQIYKLPDELLVHISKFLIQFPDKKSGEIFTKKTGAVKTLTPTPLP